ncbi:hypothetical protein EMIT0P395_20160 [Pseudomonas sp. IT-P395]
MSFAKKWRTQYGTHFQTNDV